MRSRIALLLGAAAFTFATVAQAGPVNLVANPGFEADYTLTYNSATDTYTLDDIPAWISEADRVMGLADLNNDPGNAALMSDIHSGDRAAFVETGSLSQLIATTAGQLYNVSFWYRDPSAPPGIVAKKASQQQQDLICSNNNFNAPLTAYFGTTLLLSVPECSDPTGYQEITAQILGTGNDLLIFNTSSDFYHNRTGQEGLWFLDDVSVTAVIPEPATAALTLAGLAGLVAIRRRRRRSA